MISFEVSKEIENYVCFVLSRAWDKKKILSPHEELHLRPLDSTPQCSTTEPHRLHGGRGLLQSSYEKETCLYRYETTNAQKHI